MPGHPHRRAPVPASIPQRDFWKWSDKEERRIHNQPPRPRRAKSAARQKQARRQNRRHSR
ncbi:MAG TPA: hypothetical protein DD856_12540 [Sulfobacillus sp.]|nr:hypothetical protein [Sulfobacillus sp.]